MKTEVNSLAELKALTPKKAKYGNVKTEVDGIKFDSKREAERYKALKFQEQAGVIAGLVLQPHCDIAINGIKVCRYVGDFKYWCDGKLIVEDVKGMKTAVYRLKKKLMKAVHGIEILEIK